MREKPELLEVVRRVSRARALSRKTEKAYLNHIRRFQDFHARRDLAQVGARGINEFLNHLQRAETLAASTRNQALSALAFLYRDVFGQETAECLKNFRAAKRAAKTPEVFTAEEARAVLAQMRGEPLLIAALMYGAGLRLSEAVSLRVRDIDFETGEILVRAPRTGRTVRVTILPEQFADALKRQIVNVRYLYEDDCLLGYGRIHVPRAVENALPEAARDWRWHFVFPSRYLTTDGERLRHHIAESTVQKAVGAAVLRANVLKTACCQTFRYSFAARLFEKNYEIRQIQTLLGHKNLKTTAFYMQLAAIDEKERRGEGERGKRGDK